MEDRYCEYCVFCNTLKDSSYYCEYHKETVESTDYCDSYMTDTELLEEDGND